MENKEIYREKIEQKITDVIIEDGVCFVKEDGSKISIVDFHYQDCCESVYADFDVIKYYKKDIAGKEFKEMVIKAVPEMGFLICLYQDWDKGEKIFVPCYNEQNGCYGSDLKITINKKTDIDISNLVEDNIY